MDAVFKGGQPGPNTFGVPVAPLVIDTSYGAARISVKPDELQGFNPEQQAGHYRFAQKVALAGPIGVSTVILAFQAPPTGIAILRRVQVGFQITTAFAVAQVIDFDVVRVTGMITAFASGILTAPIQGGTLVTPLVANNRKRIQGSALSLVPVIALSTANIGSGLALSGILTQDANPFGYATSMPINLAAPTAAVSDGFMPMTDLFSATENSGHPEVFSNTEGFFIRLPTGLAGTGHLLVYYLIDWTEAPGL
jgi:hypothetical protein